MRIVSAQEEQDDRYTEQKFLGRRVLSAVIDLLPHVQIIEGPAIKVERDAANVVEHDVRAEHVRDVGQCPGRLLRDARDHVVKDLGARYEDNMNGPGS